ncbi:hypothetical protein [Devosia insulae]|nr:hypothetical protein [Devosia insulae]
MTDSEWLVMRAPGFETKNDAQKFVRRLKVATMVAAVETGNGIDPGEGKPTGWISPAFFTEMFGDDLESVENIHGTQVYWDDGRQKFVSVKADATVHANAEMLAAALTATFDHQLSPTARALAALEILSLSRMAREPLAEATLCVAAVELLALREDWTSEQRELLRALKKHAEEVAPDQPEVADAVGKAYKSVRGGIKELILSTLGLGDSTWKEFDAVYGMRSNIFHGLEPISRHSISDFARNARPVCERIVIAGARLKGEF